MVQDGQSWDWRLGLAGFLVIGGAIVLSGNCALAQITPDGTLGAERSRIISPIPGGFVITGGATRGTNLFHSFQEFSVPSDGFAYFNNARNIQNIMARVTGGSVSNIDGWIAANGTANLFLINPKGIVFGPNVWLDIGGSFLASTASNVVFGNGFKFSATNPESPPLLTINVPLGLQYGSHAGSIQAQGSMLQVPNGKTLALVGGDVVLEGGILSAPNGRIELGSVVGNNLVSLTPTNTGFALSYDSIKNFQDIHLTQAIVDTSGNSGGSIQVHARNVTLSDETFMLAYTLGNQNGGGIFIQASRLRLEGGSLVNANVDGSGQGGNLTVRASDSVQVNGTSANGWTSSLSTQAQGTGQAGNLTITTGRLFVSDGAQVGTGTFGEGAGGNLNVNASESLQVIGTSANGQVISGLFTRSQGTGDAGDLTINTGKLLIQDGAQVGTDTFGRGAGGNLTVNTSESVQVIGTSANGRITSRLSAQTQGTGNAGDLTITTGQLFVSNGAQVSASTFGKGHGGSLSVTASESVQMIGRSVDGQIGSGLFAQANVGSTGNAGNLTINTRRLLVSDGAQVSASALGRLGVGGNLNVNASESVQVIGTSANGRVSSRLSAQTQGAGKAGDLTINTNQLLLQNGAQVSVSTLGGSGAGGNLNVNASESVQVTGTSIDGQIWSGLFARTQGTGDAGDLSITTGRLLVSAGAQVGAETFGKGGGGNLRVNASESVQVIGCSADNQTASRISAQTQGTGKAGDLSITTRQLLVSAGAQVGTGTFSEGAGGNLSVNASELVQLIGTSTNGRISSSLLTSSEGTGKAGDLTITTQRLLLADGAQISASTSGSGAGGSLKVNASEAVQLSGTSANGQIWSGLFARSQGTGKAGDVSITTQQLLIQNGAEVTVSSTRSGIAGNLDISADSVQLDKGEITAQTASGNGGNIALRVEDLLLLRHGSKISTTAGTAQSGGDGGNININAQFIVAVPKENSDITANAYTGQGGNINITTQGLFGIDYRPRLTPLSDITASSQFGVDGIVEINTPFVDPSQGLTQLPTNLVDVTGLIDRHCSPNQSSDRRSSFTITGRGGLPPSPNEPLRNEEVITNWITFPSEEESPDAATPDKSTKSTNQPLVEAQGWMINDQGQVVLTAETTTVTPHASWLPSPSCPASQTGTQ